MKRSTPDDLQRHLDDLGLSRNVRNLVIHSSLISFGRASFRLEDLFSAISKRVAPDCTFFAPAFTMSLEDDQPFDPASTPSQGMGAFSEFIRTRPGAIRAACPMHSYTGLGPNAEILQNTDPCLSFGANSCFDKIRSLDPHLLLLGCPFHHGATHIHQVEAEIGVPFRTWLDLKRLVKQPDGSIEEVAFRYYGIKDRESTKWSPIRVLEFLQTNDMLAEMPLPYGKSYFLKLSDLDLAARNVINQDAHALNIAKVA